MSFFPVCEVCPQCGREHWYMFGLVGFTLYTSEYRPYCSMDCLRSRLLYLILFL